MVSPKCGPETRKGILILAKNYKDREMRIAESSCKLKSNGCAIKRCRSIAFGPINSSSDKVIKQLFGNLREVRIIYMSLR